MSAFFDFILATYVGGFIWIVIGLGLFFSVKRIKDWRKNRTDGERFIKFAGICFVLIGVFVIVNLVYDTFHKT